MFIRSPKELGLFAADRRKKLKLTQTEVAERVGLQQKTISLFENKPETVMLTTAFLILSALQLDMYAEPKESGKKAEELWGELW